MPKTNAPAKAPSPPVSGNSQKTAGTSPNPTSVFITMTLDMSWRLALVVLIPIVGGFKLDEHFKLTPLLTITGFIIAMIGTGLVMWRTLQAANRQPVIKKEPKQE